MRSCSCPEIPAPFSTTACWVWARSAHPQETETEPPGWVSSSVRRETEEEEEEALVAAATSQHHRQLLESLYLLRTHQPLPTASEWPEDILKILVEESHKAEHFCLQLPRAQEQMRSTPQEHRHWSTWAEHHCRANPAQAAAAFSQLFSWN